MSISWQRTIRGPVAAALAAAALVAGCGSSGTPATTASTVAKQPTAAIDHAAADKHQARSHHARRGSPASSKRHSQTVKRPAPASPQPAIKAGVLLRSLSGVGDQAIGTLSEKATVVLQWSTTKPPIQIFNPHGFLIVNSDSLTGTVKLARGEYKGLRVASKGSWKIRIHASP